MKLRVLSAMTCLGFCSLAEPASVDVNDWPKQFAFHYDYVLTDSAGLARRQEPVEITLSAPGGSPSDWERNIRVIRIESGSRGVVVPHQVLDEVSAGPTLVEQGEPPAPAQSVNVVFFADCPAKGSVTYRLFWGMPKDAVTKTNLPEATDPQPLRVNGEAPGLTIENEHYHIELSPKSGAIFTARLAGRPESENLFYRSTPIHFGVDVWSPPQGWDHDYDWKSPPNQSLESGPLAVRYRRWGPLEHYRDVTVSITYTFFAHVPYVYVSSTMQFTADRSVRAVRMGEIVVTHSHKAGVNDKDADGKSPDLLSHYAWPDANGQLRTIEIDAHRSEDGSANLPGVVPGALGILERDVPWVAGYNTTKRYGIATLRKSQFAGNTLGGAVPQSAPCTYVSNYGWGFTYWSRPMVYPLGSKATPEDQNTALAAGAFFGTEEVLLFFVPDDGLRTVRGVYDRLVHPLQHVFAGVGPW